MKKQYVIAIGADHQGFALKKYLIKHFQGEQYDISWIDCGTFDDLRSDYPSFAQKVCEEVVKGRAVYGILLCATGIGMAIAANRYREIFAGLVWNADVARKSKEDDNCNVIVLPSDYISLEMAGDIVKNWLETDFKEGRYQQRVAMINNLPSL